MLIEYMMGKRSDSIYQHIGIILNIHKTIER